MKMTVGQNCPECRAYQLAALAENSDVVCPGCQKRWGRCGNFKDVFERCVLCGCRQFYRQKDFNQALGCLIMGIGIVLVPVTYGLSLPVFALIDWILYKRIPAMVVCYQCGAEFRGLPVPDRLKQFMHHIGMKYDRKR